MKPARPVAFIGVKTTKVVETDSEYMAHAIEAARRSLLAGEPPIGACLVRNGEPIVTLSNAGIGDLDITAHAEIRVIREACRHLRTLSLSDCRLFVTVEPCPMCLSACHYAGISEIYFGASLADMQSLTGNELMVSAAELFAASKTTMQLHGNCLRDECLALLNEWAGRTALN